LASGTFYYEHRGKGILRDCKLRMTFTDPENRLELKQECISKAFYYILPLNPIVVNFRSLKRIYREDHKGKRIIMLKLSSFIILSPTFEGGETFTYTNL
jgi:C4-dicarboxylate transporter